MLIYLDTLLKKNIKTITELITKTELKIKEIEDCLKNPDILSNSLITNIE